MRDGYDNWWERYPNPIVVEKEDLLEVLGEIDVKTMEYEDQETFADWYRMVPERIREEAAIDAPHQVMPAEMYAYSKKDAYEHMRDWNKEVRHLRREVWALQKENERLRGMITHYAAGAEIRRAEA